MDTYAQLQEIRTYYKFLDVDVDRYHLDGGYQQVMIVGARTRAVAAVGERADLGEPASAVHPRQRRRHVAGHRENHRRPAGLLSAGHSAGRLERRSHDHRAAHLFRRRRRRLRHRQGQHAGVRLSQGQRQRLSRPTTARMASPSAATAGAACSPGISTTSTSCSAGYITGESRILLHRNIQDRVRTIAPFLHLDHDPYVVVSGGRLFWMQDAYTTATGSPTRSREPRRHQLHPQLGQGGDRRL